MGPYVTLRRGDNGQFRSLRRLICGEYVVSPRSNLTTAIRSQPSNIRIYRLAPMAPKTAQETDVRAEEVLGRDDPRRLRLQEIIRAHSLKTGAFTLSSGRQSTYLFQLRQTTLLPEGAALIAEIIVEYMRGQNIASIGGLEMGAVPIVSAVAA